jgi:hypothetical protein
LSFLITRRWICGKDDGKSQNARDSIGYRWLISYWWTSTAKKQTFQNVIVNPYRYDMFSECKTIKKSHLSTTDRIRAPLISNEPYCRSGMTHWFASQSRSYSLSARSPTPEKVRSWVIVFVLKKFHTKVVTFAMTIHPQPRGTDVTEIMPSLDPIKKFAITRINGHWNQSKS